MGSFVHIYHFLNADPFALASFALVLGEPQSKGARMIRLALALCACLVVLPASAQIAPQDREAALTDAFAQLRAAPTREAADTAEAEVWALWFIGPDAEATEVIRAAAASLNQGALNLAHTMLDELVARQPDYAEAWNQRAFVKFLKGDPYGSLVDIEEVLKREPRHFGALAGRAQIERALGRDRDAARSMGEVGKVHPWMARRGVIQADPPPPEIGEKL
jgi:tetratricopeptide (TPR) repeat protein